MEFGLGADNRAGCVRGDDGGGCWSSRRWCLRRGTGLRSALKRNDRDTSAVFFTSFSLRQLIEAPHIRVFCTFLWLAIDFHIGGSKIRIFAEQKYLYEDKEKNVILVFKAVLFLF